MSHAEKDRMERIRRDLEKVKIRLKAAKAEKSSSSTSSGNGSNSDSDSHVFQAIQATDGDSDSEFKERWIKSTTAAFTEAMKSSMKGLSVKPKSSKNRYRSK